MKVRWADLDDKTFERMVAVAISRIHPSAQRIDGAGGDGGRDVQLREGDALKVFELKSFTGRVAKKQRAQIKRSLERASELTPDAWFLVVPIDPTPGELMWFDKLQVNYSFPLTWHGLTWLDSLFAAMPDIARYYGASAEHEVIELVRQLREEQAVLSSARDAVERARGLQERLNEIDPHFKYSMTLGASASASASAPVPRSAVFSCWIGDGARVDVYERYRGALDDRPVPGSIRIRLDHASLELQGQIEEALGFGGTVRISSPVLERFEVDAPGGLGGLFVSGELEMWGSEADLDPPLELVVEIVEGTSIVAALPFELVRGRGGQQGKVLYGRDQTGCLAATLRVEDTGRIDFTYTLDLVDTSALPGAIRAAGRWLLAQRPPRTRRLRFLGLEGMVIEGTIDTALVPEHAFMVVEALDDIQRKTGVSFPMPLDLTDQEASEILDTARLLNNERVAVIWSSLRMKVTPARTDIPSGLLNPEGVQFHLQGDHQLDIRGHRIPLGVVVTQLTGRVRETAELREAWSAGGEVELILEPAGTSDAVRWRKS